MGLTIHWAFKPGKLKQHIAYKRVKSLWLYAQELPVTTVSGVVEYGEEFFKRDTSTEIIPAAEREIIQRYTRTIYRHSHGGRNRYGYYVKPTYAIHFTVWPGEGCEQATFGLVNYPNFIPRNGRYVNGRLVTRFATRLGGTSDSGFCKTLYASERKNGGLVNFLRCHLVIVKLLDRAITLKLLKQHHTYYGDSYDVGDESRFWTTRNLPELARHAGYNKIEPYHMQLLRERFHDCRGIPELERQPWEEVYYPVAVEGRRHRRIKLRS